MEVVKIRRPDSLTALVLEQVEHLILSGELSPGEPVNEKALAERLSVSRGPVREACRRLEQAGLVQCFVNRGTYVRKLTADEAGELCDVRAALSGFAGRILAAKITAEQLAVLHNNLEGMGDAATRDDADEFYRLNTQFHDAIFAFAGNGRLTGLYESLGKELYLFRWRALHSHRNFQTSIAEHRAIIQALADQDAPRVGQCLEDHALAVKERLLGFGLSAP